MTPWNPSGESRTVTLYPPKLGTDVERADRRNTHGQGQGRQRPHGQGERQLAAGTAGFQAARRAQPEQVMALRRPSKAVAPALVATDRLVRVADVLAESTGQPAADLAGEAEQ